MMSIVGGIFVIACVIGGFLLEGGALPALIQPLEVLIIAGSAIGTLIICGSPHMFKEIVHRFLQILKGSGVNKQAYI
jgi:chemotaxis protein MotA